jgi:hypothetical protein
VNAGRDKRSKSSSIQTDFERFGMNRETAEGKLERPIVSLRMRKILSDVEVKPQQFLTQQKIGSLRS